MLLPSNLIDLSIERGQARYDRNRQAGNTHRWNRRDDHTPQADIAAVGAEFCAALALNNLEAAMPWIMRLTASPEGDIGPGEQVRHTVYPFGRLLLHDEDNDAHTFYLVTGTFPDLETRGRLRAVLGKVPRYWTELQGGRPCFAVPQDHLKIVIPVTQSLPSV